MKWPLTKALAALLAVSAAGAARPQQAAPAPRADASQRAAPPRSATEPGRAPAREASRVPPSSAPARAPSPRAEASARAPRAAETIDTVDLGTTSITGNQELPKVLYIVPWKQSDLGEVAGRPVNTLIDEVLSPVDPDVFKRKLEYYGELFQAGGRRGEAHNAGGSNADH